MESCTHPFNMCVVRNCTNWNITDCLDSATLGCANIFACFVPNRSVRCWREVPRRKLGFIKGTELLKCN